MVSDRPESFEEDGILFKSTFHDNVPVRLLFYHQNGSAEERCFWVELKNNSTRMSKVVISGAMAGPSRWGVTVGHQAAIRFLETCLNGNSFRLTIMPGQTMVLLETQVAPEMVIAGYTHMHLIEGGELEVAIKNMAGKRRHFVDLPVLYKPFDPFKITPKGVFEPANLEVDVKYVAGQEAESCVIGMAPWLIDPATGEPNNGNYGVFYRFNMNLSNPTSSKKRIGFYFVPDSILARGSFLFEGKLMETGIVRKPSQQLFAVLDLKAGESRKLTLITTPEGGSYYPARIVIATVDDNLAPAIYPASEDQNWDEDRFKVKKEEDDDDEETTNDS